MKFSRPFLIENYMEYTCVDGEIVIVPEQAEVARKIFENIFRHSPVQCPPYQAGH